MKTDACNILGLDYRGISPRKRGLISRNKLSGETIGILQRSDSKINFSLGYVRCWGDPTKPLTTNVEQYGRVLFHDLINILSSGPSKHPSKDWWRKICSGNSQTNETITIEQTSLSSQHPKIKWTCRFPTYSRSDGKEIYIPYKADTPSIYQDIDPTIMYFSKAGSDPQSGLATSSSHTIPWWVLNTRLLMRFSLTKIYSGIDFFPITC